MIEDELLEEDSDITKLNILNKNPNETLKEGNNEFDVNIEINGKTFKVKTIIKNFKSGEASK